MRQDLIANPDVLQGKFVTTSGEQWYTYAKGDPGFIDHGYTEGTSVDNSITNKDFKGNRKGKAILVKRVETERTTTYKFNCASTGSMAVKAAFYGGSPKAGTGNSKAFAADTAVAVGDVITVGETLLRVTTAGTTGDTTPDVAAVKKGDSVTSGGATLVSIGTAEENTIYTFKGGNTSRDVSAIFVMDTEESDGVSGNSVIVIMPNAQEQGTGNPDVEDFDGYEFTITAAANDTFMPLPEYGDFAGDTNDVIVAVVPNSRVEEVVNAYAAKLKTYRDAL